MRRLRRIHDLPVIFFKHTALLIGQAPLRVVQDQTGPQRGKGCINMDWIGITGEIDRVHAVIGEMPAQPFNAFQVGSKAVLHHKIAAKSKDICCIKQRFLLGGDKKLLRRPLKPLFNPDFI